MTRKRQERIYRTFFTDFHSWWVAKSDDKCQKLRRLLVPLHEAKSSHNADMTAAVSRMTRMIEEWLPERRNCLKEKREHASDFNVFKIIGRSKRKPNGFYDSEMNTHSPFVKELLDPSGDHGQEDYFYRTFLEALSSTRTGRPLDPAKKDRFLDIDPVHLLVTRETHLVDILVRSVKQGNRFALIIENKISAGDQERQLERYYDEIRELYGYIPQQILLIYLSTDGRSPSHYSLPAERQLELEGEGILCRLSYSDLYHWLQISRERFPSADKLKNVFEVIDQYQAVLMQLP